MFSSSSPPLPPCLLSRQIPEKSGPFCRRVKKLYKEEAKICGHAVCNIICVVFVCEFELPNVGLNEGDWAWNHHSEGSNLYPAQPSLSTLLIVIPLNIGHSTSSPIGTWKCKCPPFFLEIMTGLTNSQPIVKQTSQRGSISLTDLRPHSKIFSPSPRPTHISHGSSPHQVLWICSLTVVWNPARVQPAEACRHPREADAEADQVLPAPQSRPQEHRGPQPKKRSVGNGNDTSFQCR